MKTKLLFFFFVGLFLLAEAQTVMNLDFGGQTRQYKLYVPAIYDSTGPAVPLVIALHGINNTMDYFDGKGFWEIADTANFIFVAPQALTDPNPLYTLFGPAWNSGAAIFGLTPNTQVDDVGFLLAMTDSLSQQYNINANRIYLTGESMGSFMTSRLACEHTYRFAAMATVYGTIGSNISCNPSDLLPVAHFHGTADATVPYVNNPYGLDAAEMVEYWRQNNGADSIPVYTQLPDLRNDGFTVEHYFYPNFLIRGEVEHFKINGAGHNWLNDQDHDISYTREIWKFFSKHPGSAVGWEETTPADAGIRIWPNPVSGGVLNMEAPTGWGVATLTLIDAWGKKVRETITDQPDNHLRMELESLPTGIYYLQATGKGVTISRKILIHK